MFWRGEISVDVDKSLIDTDSVTAVKAIREFLEAIGIDWDENTRDTPERVFSAWMERLSGYGMDPKDILSKTFPVECDSGIVIVSGIKFSSTCAHHLLPFKGSITVGYKPAADNSEVVGLSKIVRLIRVYSHRLQIQESLGKQISDAIVKYLNPVGVVVIVTAVHECMSIRGVNDPDADTTTVVVDGDWSSASPEVQFVNREHSRKLK